MVHRKIHPLTMPEIEPLTITHTEFKILQTNCPMLENIRDEAINEPSYTSRSGVQSKFISENDLLYRVCINSPIKQDIGKKSCRSSWRMLPNRTETGS